MLVRLNEPLLSPQEETERSGAESIQNPGDLTLGSRGDDSQKVWAAVPKWGTGKWWALANMETLPQGAGPDGRKPSQFCRDPKAPIAFHRPIPVYRSHSRNSGYQRESRGLRNMSTHDIT